MVPPYRRLTSVGFVLVVAALAACNEIDKILEAEPPIETTLTVAVDSSHLTVPRGTERTIAVRVTRPAGYTQPVQLSFAGPDGVTASFANETTTGSTTSAMLTVKVAESVAKGTYAIGVRGKGTRINDGLAGITLNVVDPPAFTLSLSTGALTITRGGQAPLTARVARTSLTAPIDLSIDAPAGITASFVSNPVASDSSRVTIAVDQTVAPGTHTLTFRGETDGLAARTTTLSLTVTDDPVQLIVPTDLAGPQGATAQTDMIVNRSSYSGSVALSAEDVPADVTVLFSPNAPTTTSSTVTVAIGPLAPTGQHTIRVRGQGTGVPDAVTEFKLTVAPTTLSLSVAPASVSQFVGTNSSSTLSITRSGYAAAVNLVVENAPAGVSIVPQQSITLQTSVPVAIAAAPNAAPGDYVVTIRGTLEGFPPITSKTATLNLTVREAATAGNVILDWGRCGPPAWVAYQDDVGPWVPVTPTAGVYRFAINGTRGGYAWADASNVGVRFMTQGELAAKAIDMCLPPAPTKTINGIGLHSTTTGEVFNYRLGGATATSLPTQPQFALAGVADGPQDLVAIGTTPGVGSRILFMRDINLADGESLGQVDVMGAAAFPFLGSSFIGSGVFVTGESLQYSMSYLTGASCSVNLLTSGFAGFGTNTVQGLPALAQRPTDFHMLTYFTSAATWSRSATLEYHDLAQRVIALPQLPVAPGVFVAAGANPYKRLTTTIALPIVYSRMTTLQYTSGVKTMSVGGTLAYFGGVTTFTLTMPDFTAVSGWPASAPIASNGTGSWSVTYEGSNTTAPPCTEGRQTSFARRNGTFF